MTENDKRLKESVAQLTAGEWNEAVEEAAGVAVDALFRQDVTMLKTVAPKVAAAIRALKRDT